MAASRVLGEIVRVFKDGDITSILTATFGLGFLYTIGQIVYSLYFSPLAKFPGPKIAAITRWYEAYYEIILKGQYEFKIKEWHDKYGAYCFPPWNRPIYMYQLIDFHRKALS